MGKNITADQGRNERCIGMSSVTNSCNQIRNNVYRRALNPTWNRQALNTERMLVLVENMTAIQCRKAAEILRMASATNSWTQLRNSMRYDAVGPMLKETDLTPTQRPLQSQWDKYGRKSLPQTPEMLRMTTATNSWNQSRAIMHCWAHTA